MFDKSLFLVNWDMKRNHVFSLCLLNKLSDRKQVSMCKQIFTEILNFLNKKSFPHLCDGYFSICPLISLHYSIHFSL